MKKIILIIFVLLIPQITNARVYISEIMYDLEGTDSGREWIEVHNDTDENLELSNYYLFENNVSHRISGDQIVGPREYAIIADSIEKFMIDWPNYNGKIFDSAFALNNTGEELILQNSNKEFVDGLTYNSDLGANGNGNSLQLYEGVLIPGLPTPGKINVTEPADESPPASDDANPSSSSSSSSNSGSTHSGQNDLSDYKPKNKAKTGIGRDRVVLVNTPIEFEVFISDEEEKGKFFWNFGDGNSEKGKVAKNTYKHSGEYNVVLNSHFKDYKNTSRVTVKVYEPNIEILNNNNVIQIKNNGEREVNIGEFVLKSDQNKIKIIKDTIISKGQSIYFDFEEIQTNIVFEYPNGKEYYSWKIKKATEYCELLKTFNLNCSIDESVKLFDSI